MMNHSADFGVNEGNDSMHRIIATSVFVIVFKGTRMGPLVFLRQM